MNLRSCYTYIMITVSNTMIVNIYFNSSLWTSDTEEHIWVVYWLVTLYKDSHSKESQHIVYNSD